MSISAEQEKPLLPLYSEIENQKPAPPPPPPQQDSLAVKYAWLAIYFGLNLALTLYNKSVMGSKPDRPALFPFPYLLTGLHALCGSIGCLFFYARGAFTFTRLSEYENIVMLLFSGLYTINIAISNVSLNLVTVPFHQVVRAMTPFFTVIIFVVCFRKTYGYMTYISLIPVVAGVGFATAGDYYFTPLGFFLTLLGAFLAAMKTVVTNKVQTGRLRLSPLELLARMSPLAFLQTLLYSYYTGEMSKARTWFLTSYDNQKGMILLLNGAIAFALNVISFTANKKTGALTMTVAANVKQILTIVISFAFYDLRVTWLNSIGIILTLVGGAWYAKVELEAKQNRGTIQQKEVPALQHVVTKS
ncbi:UAA transporter [Orbilia brochopaga]|uniref:UAA transporter n=1 Tax=Orbilia brochopaga TaxID=3140254 RepID=A0AAV9U6P2_9PEZI